jgi:hypothetical protein
MLYSPGGTAIDTQNPPAQLPAIMHTPRGRRVHDPELVRQILASRQEQSRTLTGQVGRLLTILETLNEREEVDRDLQDGLMAHDGAFFAEAQDEAQDESVLAKLAPARSNNVAHAQLGVPEECIDYDNFSKTALIRMVKRMGSLDSLPKETLFALLQALDNKELIVATNASSDLTKPVLKNLIGALQQHQEVTEEMLDDKKSHALVLLNALHGNTVWKTDRSVASKTGGSVVSKTGGSVSVASKTGGSVSVASKTGGSVAVVSKTGKTGGAVAVASKIDSVVSQTKTGHSAVSASKTRELKSVSMMGDSTPDYASKVSHSVSNTGDSAPKTSHSVSKTRGSVSASKMRDSASKTRNSAAKTSHSASKTIDSASSHGMMKKHKAVTDPPVFTVPRSSRNTLEIEDEIVSYLRQKVNTDNGKPMKEQVAKTVLLPERICCGPWQHSSVAIRSAA